MTVAVRRRRPADAIRRQATLTSIECRSGISSMGDLIVVARGFLTRWTRGSAAGTPMHCSRHCASTTQQRWRPSTNLADRDALAVPSRAATPAEASRFSLAKVPSALKHAGRQRNIAPPNRDGQHDPEHPPPVRRPENESGPMGPTAGATAMTIEIVPIVCPRRSAGISFIPSSCTVSVRLPRVGVTGRVRKFNPSPGRSALGTTSGGHRYRPIRETDHVPRPHYKTFDRKSCVRWCFGLPMISVGAPASTMTP